MNPDQINVEKFFESFVNKDFLKYSPGSCYVLKKDIENTEDNYEVLMPTNGAKRRKISNEILMIDFLYLMEMAFQSYIKCNALDLAIDKFSKKNIDFKPVISSDIFVDKIIVSTYREDIKYFLLMKNLLTKYQSEFKQDFGDIFSNWILIFNKK